MGVWPWARLRLYASRASGDGVGSPLTLGTTSSAAHSYGDDEGAKSSRGVPCLLLVATTPTPTAQWWLVTR